MNVSVVITTFNSGQYLGEAIDSILAQDIEEFECIVIDDGSTDNTSEILSARQDPRLKAYTLPANCGIGIARNIGMRCATGKYMAVMDADDIAFPNRLSSQYRYMEENPEIHILGTRTTRIRDSVTDIIDNPQHPLEDSQIKARLLLLNGTAMINPTSMVRMDFVNRHQLSYPARSMDEDHGFWIQCVAAGGKFHTLQDILLYKRRHQGNITLTSADTKEAGKLALRCELISLYYPQLTYHEAKSLAFILQPAVSLSINQAREGLNAGAKAMTESRSLYGESKQLLREILSAHMSRIDKALKAHRAQA